jgi:hypothetical protein
VTDKVKSISPFVIGYIGFTISVPINIKKIYPIINGDIGFTISVTGPGTDKVIWTLISPFIIGHIGYDFIGTESND